MAITPSRSSADVLQPARSGSALLRAPRTDVLETKDQIQIDVELPGMRPDDVDVSIDSNVLTISGEKREEREEREQTYHLAERLYGRFSRSFVLPRDVEPENIRASFESGVLTVTVPKNERAKRRRIEIRGG